MLTEWNLEPLPSKYSKIMEYTYVKLPSFGVDMFFLKLLESKKWEKID